MSVIHPPRRVLLGRTPATTAQASSSPYGANAVVCWSSFQERMRRLPSHAPYAPRTGTLAQLKGDPKPWMA